MEIQAVVAVSRTGGVGVDGGVPWSYPVDFEQYRDRVRGGPVVVGRRTFEEMDPVPGSTNLVVTRDESRSSTDERVRFVTSRSEAVTAAAATGGDTVSVIGGGEIYRLFLPFTDRAFVSELPEQLAGDAQFPYLGAGWQVVSERDYEAFRLVEYENTSSRPRSEL